MSMYYYLDRIFWAVVLLGAGVFCLKKMVTTKPHKLIKEEHYRISFRSDLPHHMIGEQWAEFHSSRSSLAGTVLFTGAALFLLTAGLVQKEITFFVCLIPVFMMIFHTLSEGTQAILICQYGIQVKSLLKTRFYSYHELDGIESYNVVNAFYRGTSYGYCLVKEGQVILKLDIRQYHQAGELEEIFRKHSEVLDTC